MRWDVQIGQLAHDVTKYETKCLWNVFNKLNRFMKWFQGKGFKKKNVLSILLELSLVE